MGLQATASRGGLLAVGGQWFKYFLQIVAVIVLARMLPPSQYGLIAMITAIVGVAAVIRDFGLSNATMRAKSLTHSQVSALFWMNTGIGLVCAIACASGAGLIAGFYHRPALVHLTMVLSVVFVLDGAAAQFQANLARNMAYGRIVAADVVSTGAGVVIGIIAAKHAPNAWALVYMQVSTALFSLIILVWSNPFLPGRVKGAKVRELLAFGRNVTVVQLLDYASRNVDTILVGRYWGAFQVGLYNNAYQLLLLPLQQINAPLTRVALPVLSRLEHDRQEYEDYLAAAFSTISYATTLLYGALAGMATLTIEVLLGQKWAAAGPIFQAMAVAGVLQALNYVNYWQFMALNRTHVHVRYALLTKPIVVLGFVIAAPHGVAAVAWSYTITTALVAPGSFYLACRGTGVNLRRLFLAGVRPFPLGALLCGVLLVAQHYVTFGGHIAQLAECILLGLMTIGIAMALVPTYRRDLFRIFEILMLGVRRTVEAE